jgi:hypothetical protein
MSRRRVSVDTDATYHALVEELAKVRAERDRLAARLQHALRDFHAPKCPADHNCGRDHPGADVYHEPLPCTCGGLGAVFDRLEAAERVVDAARDCGGCSKILGNALDAYDEAARGGEVTE